jgi:hypothetical protein
LGLLALCEIGLLREFARAYRFTSAILSVILAIAGLFAIMGFWSLLTAGSVISIAWIAIGVIPWFIVAPVVALGCARAGLLGRAPATAAGLLSLLVLVASATRDPPLVLVAYAAYRLGWSWLGYALLRPPSPGRAPPSVDSPEAPRPENIDPETGRDPNDGIGA